MLAWNVCALREVERLLRSKKFSWDKTARKTRRILGAMGAWHTGVGLRVA